MFFTWCMKMCLVFFDKSMLAKHTILMLKQENFQILWKSR